MAMTWRPERRNRNSGTERAGQGRSNRMRIPETWLDRDGRVRSYVERLSPARTVRFDLNSEELVCLCETPAQGFTYGCSPEDVAHLLAQAPSKELAGLRIIAFRQPTRKQAKLNPVWGRLLFDADFGRYRGPAIVIEATDLARPLVWPRKLSPDGQRALARLRADGHSIEEDRRGYAVHFTPGSVRQGILYRTLLHELGHWVDWQRHGRSGGADYFARPVGEREAFAHAYADRLGARLRRQGAIPFPPPACCDIGK